MTETVLLYGVNGERYDLINDRLGNFAWHFSVGPNPNWHGPPPSVIPEHQAPRGSRRGTPRDLRRRISFDIKARAVDNDWLKRGLREFAVATHTSVAENRLVVGDREIMLSLESGTPIVEACDSFKTSFPTVWRAHWPYWRALADEIVPVTVGVGGSRPAGGYSYNEPFDYNVAAPYNGLRISEAGTVEIIITNTGTVDVYPRWTVTGPATQINIVNRSTSEAFTVDGFVPEGSELLIDALPEAADPILLDSTDRNLSWLERGSVMFALRPGENRIIFDVRGAIDSSSTVTCSFRPEYLTS